MDVLHRAKMSYLLKFCLESWQIHIYKKKKKKFHSEDAEMIYSQFHLLFSITKHAGFQKLLSFRILRMSPQYTQPPPPKKKMFLNNADRSSGVVFLSVSGFLGKSGTLLKTKGGCCPFSDEIYSLVRTVHWGGPL